MGPDCLSLGTLQSLSMVEQVGLTPVLDPDHPIWSPTLLVPASVQAATIAQPADGAAGLADDVDQTILGRAIQDQ